MYLSNEKQIYQVGRERKFVF